MIIPLIHICNSGISFVPYFWQFLSNTFSIHKVSLIDYILRGEC